MGRNNQLPFNLLLDNYGDNNCNSSADVRDYVAKLGAKRGHYVAKLGANQGHHHGWKCTAHVNVRTKATRLSILLQHTVHFDKPKFSVKTMIMCAKKWYTVRCSMILAHGN